MQVVHAGQHRRQHLAAAIEVMKIGAREARTGHAGAGRIERRVVFLVAGISNAQVAETCEEMAVAGVSRRHDAVEHVDAGADAVDQVFRRADAHQVARLVGRQAVRRVRDDALHLGLRLADADTTDRIAGQAELGQGRHRFLAQGLEHAALDDAEQRVRVLQARELVARAARPAQAHLHRGAHRVFAGDPAFDLVGGALVELHHDVAVEYPLDLHAHLGCEEQLVAVDRRGEGDALLAHLRIGAERPDLKAAAVGEDGARPGLEAMQAAEPAQDVEARAQPEVKGVAEDDLGAHRLERGRQHALDGAVGAHRHEGRRLDAAVIECEAAAPGLSGSGENSEGKHVRLSRRLQAARASSIASP